MVCAASIALTIASSVASTAASYTGSMTSSLSIDTEATPRESGFPVGPVENAMNRSPEPAPAIPPIRPTPSAARRAMRRSWCGSSGASVASTTMIEPCSVPRGVAPAPAPDGAGQRSPASEESSGSRVS